MDMADKITLYSVMIYILHVLIPLAPACLIYWLFPATSTTVTGPLSKITIKASGAFAAYVIVFLLGFHSAQKADQRLDDLLNSTQNQMWTVKGRVELIGVDHKDENKLLENLRVTIYPPLYDLQGKYLVLMIPNVHKGNYMVKIEGPEFIGETINFEDWKLEWDHKHRIVKLRDSIKMQRYGRREDIGTLNTIPIKEY